MIIHLHAFKVIHLSANPIYTKPVNRPGDNIYLNQFEMHQYTFPVRSFTDQEE